MAWNDVERRGPRMMGETERWHVWPTVQRQTVADHSWHVMRIYQEVFGFDTVGEVLMVMHHDSPESWTGDVPSHAKRDMPDVRLALLRGEREFCEAHDVPDANNACGLHAAKLKIADLLEMFEFSMREVQLGNVHGHHVMNTTLSAVRTLFLGLDREVIERPVRRWVAQRLAEHETAVLRKPDTVSQFWGEGAAEEA